MEFKQIIKQEFETTVGNLYVKDFLFLYEYIKDIADEFIVIPNKQKSLPFDNKQEKLNLKDMRHLELKKLFIELFSNNKFKELLYQKLSSSITSHLIYSALIWQEKYLNTTDAIKLYKLDVQPYKLDYYEHKKEHLTGELALIEREGHRNSRNIFDILRLDKKIKELLRYIFPLPDDYMLKNTDEPTSCDFLYNNESGVFDFIDSIEGMLVNSLIEFGATNEKPLAKTINILKSTTSVNEFYEEDKKANTIAVDMLTRSFYFYYHTQKKFRANPLETLKSYLSLQLKNKLTFFISRILASHLKKVRFDSYYSSQNELFNLTEQILKEMPKNGWVSFLNIINYCKYRDIRFDLEASHKTDEYYMTCNYLDLQTNEISTLDLSADHYYQELFFEPVLKGIFFYLASLGIVEIAYDKPVSPYAISAKDATYISLWDGLQYVRFTNLGLYCLGFINNYEMPVITNKKQTTLKFDNYKPIISLDKNDAIMIAKLEPYTEKYDEDRYILSYMKIFRDCKDRYSLDLKIKNFYKIIQVEPPKVFVNFFDEIIQNANMLKLNLSVVVIDLQSNKKLLNLFMTHKKLQELIIKAQGYKVIIAREDISKLTKIVKENGFFIEF